MFFDMHYFDEEQWEICNFSDLEKSTVIKIEGVNIGSEQVVFHTSSGLYLLYHQDNCCESVSIEDITGEPKDLIGGYISLAEESSNKELDSDIYESATWTFYNISTTKGDLSLRWLGTSNGYYSENVSVVKQKVEYIDKVN